jgi:hypothetical protein
MVVAGMVSERSRPKADKHFARASPYGKKANGAGNVPRRSASVNE